MQFLTNISKKDKTKELVNLKESNLVRFDTAHSLKGSVLDCHIAILCNQKDRLKILNILSPKTFPISQP